MNTAQSTDVRTTVTQIFATVLSLPGEQVTGAAHFYDDLGGDSLQKLEIVAHLEAAFNCRLSNEEAAENDSVDAFVRLVGERAA
ncbi:acyl carrier protein [Streptomyces sp. NPDC006552]|uniref:acyl carrier protein n=1 Tax=Streptomyces sp. NPDC006552 TaxID=3157179 RepID=UPI0033B7E77C